MKKFYKNIKNNSEILMIIFMLAFVIMLMINILFVNIINDKNAYINGLKSDKTLCNQKYDSLVQDYEKLEEVRK